MGGLGDGKDVSLSGEHEMVKKGCSSFFTRREGMQEGMIVVKKEIKVFKHLRGGKEALPSLPPSPLHPRIWQSAEALVSADGFRYSSCL